jgi:hypothetical protein
MLDVLGETCITVARSRTSAAVAAALNAVPRSWRADLRPDARGQVDHHGTVFSWPGMDS